MADALHDAAAAKAAANRFRRKRFALVAGMLAEIAKGRPTIRVLDLGGTAAYWLGLRDMWGHLDLDLTLINVGVEPTESPPFRILPGNACDLSHLADWSFDFVHSNSVIEHVGHWNEMTAMAREVRRLAPRYYVQTPNFGFPLEPHFRTLFFHWYPESVRAGMLMRRRRGFYDRRASMDEAMRAVQGVDLLTAGQMAALFPDARIARERVAGLAKSIIAMR